MKSPAFEYTAPTSVEEAVDILTADEEAKLLAGGQSLVPLLNMRLVRPSRLVDLRRIDGLGAIERVNGHLRIGAMARQRDVELSPAVEEACPVLVQALGLVAHPQIRSRGTICGSLAHADPAAELPAVALLLDGILRVTGPAGERAIRAEEFFQTYFTTSLAHGEVLTALELPVQPPNSRFACLELTRRPGDFPLCGAATQLTLSLAGDVETARIALFGVSHTPVRARAAETLLVGSRHDRDALAEASRAAAADLDPPTDQNASADFRRHLAGVVVRRALEQALAGGEQ